MDLSNFKLLKEDSDSYHVSHPNGKPLVVSKSGLSAKAHEIIKKLNEKTNMPEGGTVPANPPESAPEVPEALKPNEPAVQAPVPMPSGDQQQASPVAPEASNPQQMLESKDKDVRQSLEEQKRANIDIAKAKSEEASAGANAIDAVQKKIDQMPSQQDIFNQYQAKSDALMKAYQDKQIDPQRFYKEMSVPSKIGAAIGMLISGFGSGLAGQQNQALEMMKRNVDNDIEAQKADKESSRNLWAMNREAMGSNLQADLATKNQMYLGVKYKIEQSALQAGTPMALAQAKLANSQIDQQIAANNYQLSLLHTGMGSGTNGKYAGDDPSVLVPQLIKEPATQAKALEEIRQAKVVKDQYKNIMNAFDEAAKHRNDLANAVPGYKLPQLKQFDVMLGPTFNQVEHTVRQAAMDNMENNVHPQYGDKDDTIAQKRKALESYMTDTVQAPTAKAHGIDLTKFSSTNVEPISADKNVRDFMKKNPQYSEEQAKQMVEKFAKEYKAKK